MRSHEEIKSINFANLSIAFSVGCAAIIHGTKQDISVNSNPSGVNVYVMGVHKATTPAIIEVRRKDSIIILKFEKEGYEPVEIALSRSVDGWIWGNIVFGALIGLVVDFSSGAAYKFSLDNVTANMEKLATLNSNNLYAKAFLQIEIRDVD